MARRLLLIRHATTGAANHGRMVGSTDVPADPAGLIEAGRLPEVLAAFQPQACYCSPMRRARQTAQKLTSAFAGADRPCIEPLLREINFGRWEMQTWQEIMAAEDAAMIERWGRYTDFVFPGGEAVKDFIDRVGQALEKLRVAEEREIAVVTHGGVIRTMICLSLGLDARNYLLFNVQPGTVTVLDLYEQGGLLSGLNL